MVKSKAQLSKMDNILSDAHPDTKIAFLIMVVPELEYSGAVREGITKLVKKLETVEVIAAKRFPGCSKATRFATLGSELGMHQIITNGEDRSDRKRQYSEGGTK